MRSPTPEQCLPGAQCRPITIGWQDVPFPLASVHSHTSITWLASRSSRLLPEARSAAFKYLCRQASMNILDYEVSTVVLSSMVHSWPLTA